MDGPAVPEVRLWLPDGMEPGPEFALNPRKMWTAYLPRTEMDRIYFVVTHAQWGEHAVEVVQRRDDGRLRVQGWTYPAPPGTTRPENTYWQVVVEPQDLTDVVETVQEFAP